MAVLMAASPNPREAAFFEGACRSTLEAMIEISESALVTGNAFIQLGLSPGGFGV